MLKLHEQLREIEDEKCKGGIIRSKAKYIVEGERSTKFFFFLIWKHNLDFIPFPFIFSQQIKECNAKFN